MIRIVLASLGLALAFQQASLTGEWSAVVTAPRGVYDTPVAETCIGFMFALGRRIREPRAEPFAGFREHAW